MKLLTLLFCCVTVAGVLHAQENEILLRGLSVYAGSNEQHLPLVIRKVDNEGKPVGKYGYITIQFDILASHPPELKVRFYHCNRDWKVDENLFVNDSNHNTSFYLDYTTSPGGR